MRSTLLLACAVALISVGLDAQTKKRRAPAPKAKPAALKSEPAKLECPHVLGTGVATSRSFCDVLTGADPLGGAVVKLPPHKGTATLTFDLHNRHMYSADLVASGRAYTRATATIGVLTMDKTLLTRAIVQTEFRKVDDLFDRVEVGGGGTGVKAVAPIGRETVVIDVPEKLDAVSILGEKLAVTRGDGSETVTGGGRPIAVVSNVRLDYRPAPAPAKSTKSKSTKPKSTKSTKSSRPAP
jgi:hypothetical protein